MPQQEREVSADPNPYEEVVASRLLRAEYTGDPVTLINIWSGNRVGQEKRLAEVNKLFSEVYGTIVVGRDSVSDALTGYTRTVTQLQPLQKVPSVTIHRMDLVDPRWSKSVPFCTTFTAQRSDGDTSPHHNLDGIDKYSVDGEPRDILPDDSTERTVESMFKDIEARVQRVISLASTLTDEKGYSIFKFEASQAKYFPVYKLALEKSVKDRGGVATEAVGHRRDKKGKLTHRILLSNYYIRTPAGLVRIQSRLLRTKSDREVRYEAGMYKSDGKAELIGSKAPGAISGMDTIGETSLLRPDPSGEPPGFIVFSKQ